jgi:hypothetical protein
VVIQLTRQAFVYVFMQLAEQNLNKLKRKRPAGNMQIGRQRL